MPKQLLTDAMRDSHRMTMQIHLEAAKRLILENDWNAAKTALELALPHANAVGHKETKAHVFGLLNSARAKVKKAAIVAKQTVQTELANTDG